MGDIMDEIAYEDIRKIFDDYYEKIMYQLVKKILNQKETF